MPHKAHRLPSVTQIIGILDKPFLKRWYGTVGWDECERIKRESADYGTKIHEMISLWLKHGDSFEDYPFHDGPMLDRFRWEYKATPIEVEPEEPYVSKKYKYSGTFDWVEKDADGTLVIADLKITSQMHPEYALQLAAYANLYNERHGTNIDLGRIYRIDKKTGKLQIKEYPHLKQSFKVFKCLIPVWKWVNGK